MSVKRVVAKRIEDTDVQPAEAPPAASGPSAATIDRVLARLDAISERLDRLDRRDRATTGATVAVSERRSSPRPVLLPGARSRMR